MKKFNITNNPNGITNKDIAQYCHSGRDLGSSENSNISGLRIESAMTNQEKGIVQVKARIGENLFKIRRERGLSLHSASILMGAKKNHLDWLERGSGCMNLSKLIKLANFYKIDMKDLFR